MKIIIIKKEDTTTNKWAGGTTTELFIYPEGTSFAERDFDFRLSHATVEVESSEFTFFKGIHRHLMILEGELNIQHHDHYSKALKKFDQDEFSGEWKTSAKGKVTDFNLMLGKNAVGRVKALVLEKDTISSIIGESNVFFSGYYLWKGELKLEINDHTYDLSAGDFIANFTENTIPVIKIYASEDCELICSDVVLNS